MAVAARATVAASTPVMAVLLVLWAPRTSAVAVALRKLENIGDIVATMTARLVATISTERDSAQPSLACRRMPNGGAAASP